MKDILKPPIALAADDFVVVDSLFVVALIFCVCSLFCDMSQCMRFPTMWYVRPAEPQISLRIRAV